MERTRDLAHTRERILKAALGEFAANGLAGARCDRNRVETLIAQLRPLDPPSWRRCWYDTGRLLPIIFPITKASDWLDSKTIA